MKRVTQVLSIFTIVIMALALIPAGSVFAADPVGWPSHLCGNSYPQSGNTQQPRHCNSHGGRHFDLHHRPNSP